MGTWYKKKPTDKIWWKETPGRTGEFVFSFDKKREYNFFSPDYDKLTSQQKAIFAKENPMLAELK